ncbi:MAG: hypothetical protein R3F30_09130 [Planctomycetota bacterium]
MLARSREESCTFFRHVIFAVVLFSCLLLGGSEAGAQGGLGQRREFIFHVWVNPLHGDDAYATTQNPVGTWIPVPSNEHLLGLAEHPYLQPSPLIKGFLQNAPHEFRTVTAALAYVQAQFYLPPTNKLPWVYPGPIGPARSIDWIVIHCLPGLYGPYTVSAR